jgi:hypothetical protein
MPRADAGIAQHLLEGRRLAAVLAQQAEGRIEPRLNLDGGTGGAGEVLRSGEQRRWAVRHHDQQCLLEARVEAGDVGEIGGVLAIRIDDQRIETGCALRIDGSVEFRTHARNAERRQRGVDQSKGWHSGPPVLCGS